jgi:pimeloyl-ACP methyl ester carboxylesterase
MRIKHGRISLELHERRSGSAPTLLLLHELFASACDWGAEVDAWPGRVVALDFAGHGASDRLRGGAYMAEMLLGDADAALAAVGSAALCGKGVGAYVALLLAGARRDAVSGALLLPGRGLAGGGAWPNFTQGAFAGFFDPPPASPDGCDPRVHVLEKDVRPCDYAERFARGARRVLLSEDGSERPPWWETTRGSPTASPAPGDFSAALAELLRVAT